MRRAWRTVAMVWALLTGCHLCRSMPVHVPALYTDYRVIQMLVAGGAEIPEQAHLRVALELSARTNVMPLEWGTRQRLPTATFQGKSAYYELTRCVQVSVQKDRLRLMYTRFVIDRYDGSSGAAQLYLDSQGLGIRYFRQYDIKASMNNADLGTWTIETHSKWATRYGEASAMCAISLINTHRIQQGHLFGDMWALQLQGQLNLDTTRGLPPPRAQGWGLTTHFGVVVPLPRQHKVGVWVENALGGIWEQRMQRIQAQVATNTVVPDADGFLRGVPFLQGTVQEITKPLVLQKRLTFGWCAPAGAGNVVMLLKAAPERAYVVGYVGRANGIAIEVPRGRYVWYAHRGAWHWSVGISQMDFARARQVQVSLAYSLPLNDSAVRAEKGRR